MTMDPRDFLLPSRLVDATRFNSVVRDALSIATVNPYSAFGTTVQASSALRDLISPSGSVLNSATLTPPYLNSAYSTLASMREPLLALGASAIAPYASTYNALNTAASLGTGVRDLYQSAKINSSALAFTTVPLGSAAFQVGVANSVRLSSAVTSPYIASSSAAFALESSLAKFTGVSCVASESLLLGHSAISALQSNVLTVSGALRDTWEAIRSDHALLSSASVSTLRAPAVEFYSATQAAAAVSLPIDHRPAPDLEIEEIIEEAVDAFEGRIAALHQGLVAMYRGGIDALTNGGTDWQRHAMVSFRELATRALHLLAPDSEILPKAKESDLHNGKPTRQARLNHIFAAIAGPEIAKFYEADIKAAISLYELLNDVTHRLENDASPKQVHYIQGRVVGLITSMLDARGI